MAKTQEELNELKEGVETLNKKLAELDEDELAQVSGGSGNTIAGECLKLPVMIFGEILGAGHATCRLCGQNPAARALANHLVNFHGYTREDALAAVPEGIRGIQWD